jgi:hypothetical protein
MHKMRILAVVLLLAIPGFAFADLADAGIPDSSTWYLHVDLEEMRTSDAGSKLYAWFDGEFISEVREEFGIDLSKEADRITAFSAQDAGTVVSIEGNVSQDSQDKLLALAASADELQTMKFKGKTFYYCDGDGSSNGNIEIDSFDSGIYFSFALKNRIIITSTREQMESLLASKGKIVKRSGPSGTLFVLTAEKSLVQAGLRPDEIDADDDWESNILRNAEHIALLIADVAGNIAVEVRLVTREAEMAESLASIVRGLISLAAFDDDMEPEIAEVLRSTKVAVEERALTIKVALNPDLVVATLED